MIDQFHFLRPEWLLLLLPLGGLLWLLHRHRFDSANWRQVIDPRLLPFVLSGTTQGNRRWPRYLLALLGVIGSVALAGPTWEKLPQPVYHRQSGLVIVLDLSRSMDAADIKPSRLARARLKIADILNLRKEGQTALVVYAADAFSVVPLTDDVDTILALLPALESRLMPAQGSRADRGFALAFELLANAGVARGDVLLISDGLGETELDRVRDLLDAHPGHRLSVLAVGTRDGGPVPMSGGGFLQDRDGSIVIATLQDSGLRQVAQSGGGVYASISTDDIDINTLDYLLESGLDLRAAREGDLSTELWRDLGPWLLLGALPFAALAFRRGLIYLLPLCLFGLPPDADALDWDGIWRNSEQRAHALFERDAHAEAAQQFSDPAWRAAAQYRAGDYAAALESWIQLDGETARYNAGNALAKAGRYEEALSTYDKLLQQNPEHADARFNKESIEEWLRQQPSQSAQDSPESGEQSQSGQEQSQAQSQAQSSGQPADSGADETDPGDDQQSEQQAQQQAAPEQSSANPDENAMVATQENDANPQTDQGLASLEDKMSEQAAEQWLRKIPDDPGGLLRRKFLYQYRQRGAAASETQPW